jgi:hypothetical protein
MEVAQKTSPGASGRPRSSPDFAAVRCIRQGNDLCAFHYIIRKVATTDGANTIFKNQNPIRAKRIKLKSAKPKEMTRYEVRHGKMCVEPKKKKKKKSQGNNKAETRA